MSSIPRDLNTPAPAYSKGAKRRRKAKLVSLAATPTTWDTGATGPANRINLKQESATDIDPETGRETPNPNGIKRQRRASWVRIYGAKEGGLKPEHVAAAEKLRMASEGMQERDPLASSSGIRHRGEHDPEAARVDARRYFRDLWSEVPTDCRPVVQRVVLDDMPIWSGCGQAAHQRHMKRLVRGLDAIR